MKCELLQKASSPLDVCYGLQPIYTIFIKSSFTNILTTNHNLLIFFLLFIKVGGCDCYKLPHYPLFNKKNQTNK